MISVEFLITSLVVVLIPGTGVIYTVSTGLTQGRGASVFAALGCTAGTVPHLLATVLGLAAVMHASALAFQVLKYAGVAYLFYVAYATWHDKSAFAMDGGLFRASASGLMIKAFLLNILNPKLTIFFLAFLPQFVEPGSGQPLLELLLLSAVFMAMTFVVFVVYGFVAHAFRKLVIESARVQRWLRYSFAATFAGLGARLALSEK
jgi:threonine/homoserine/homoserine lactone efflux protein